MYRYNFWKDAFERAAKTVAQTLITLGLFGPGLNLLDIDWAETFGICLSSFVLSILTSIVSTRVGTAGTASLTSEANAPTDGSEI